MKAVSEYLPLVLACAAGVLLAGYIMNKAYDSNGFIEAASDGFDM